LSVFRFRWGVICFALRKCLKWAYFGFLYFVLFVIGLFWLSAYGKVYTLRYDIRYSRNLCF
jgi:hypothetical protein